MKGGLTMNELTNFGQMANDLFTEEELAEIQREAIAEAEEEAKKELKAQLREQLKQAYKEAHKKAYIQAQKANYDAQLNRLKEKISKTIYDSIKDAAPEAAEAIKEQQKVENLNKSKHEKISQIYDSVDSNREKILRNLDSQDMEEIHDIAVEEEISIEEAADKMISKKYDNYEPKAKEQGKVSSKDLKTDFDL